VGRWPSIFCHFYGGLRLPAGKHTSILTDIQTIGKKKMKKKCFFFWPPRAQRTEIDQLIQGSRGTGILWHGHPGRVFTFHGLEARATREGLFK